MIETTPRVPHAASASAIAPRRPAWVLVGGTLLAVAVGAFVAWPRSAAASALIAAGSVWLAGVIWGATRRPVALAFLGIQAWWVLGVLIGGTFAVIDGYAEIGSWRFRGAVAEALALAAVADGAVWFGAVLARLRSSPSPREGAKANGGDATARRIRRVPVDVSRGRLDRWAVAFVVAGLASFGVYVGVAGADLSALNVLTGSARYGDLARSSDGVVVKYLKSFAALAGLGIVLVGIRLARSHHSWLVPAVVGVIATVLLSASGGRSWLVVPAVAAGLLWLKTSPRRMARRPGAVLLVGAVGLFAFASIIGGLRGQSDTKQIDVGAFAAKEVRVGVFAPTVGLLETVPEREPYVGGSSYAAIAAMPVPRALWEEKPEYDLLPLQIAVFGKHIGASFGFHGELFANFGWIGVAGGCFAFGLVLEAVWLAFVRTGRLSSAVLAAGALAVLAQLFTRDYVVGQLAGQFGFLVGILVLARAVDGAADRPA